MLITILSPELIVSHAALEVLMAVDTLKRMQEKGKSVKLSWWLFSQGQQESKSDAESQVNPDDSHH